MSNNVKKNLIDTLNNLLDNSVSNNSVDQVGGKRYSQKEVDDMLMASLFNIMTLYQKSVSDTKMIKNQIQQILQQHSGVQTGGSRSYSRAEVDSVMTNSLQQIMGLYMQSENERHQLARQLQQLQMGGVSGKNVVSSAIKVGPKTKVFTKVSVNAIQNYIESLKKTKGIVVEYDTLSLLILNDLSNVPKDTDSNSFGLVGKNNGGTTIIFDVSANPGNPSTKFMQATFKYNNSDVPNLTKFAEIFKKNAKDTTDITTTKLTPSTTNIILQVMFDPKTGAIWEPTDDVLNLLNEKGIQFDVASKGATEFDLSSNDKFIEQLDDKYQVGKTQALKPTDDSVKTAIQFIRGHLMEKIANGTIKPDLE
jgi:hypothetical protein